jgi:hypothetical protein
MADKKKTLKEKIKSAYKKFEDIAASGALGTGGAGIKKKEKAEVVVDPDETFGGRRIQKKGPPIKKRIYQEDLHKKPSGLGAALRGGGKAFMKGGRVK